MKQPNKKMLSGVKPTGRCHLGTYLGAMRQFVDLQESHDIKIFIADLHALNSIYDPDRMQELSREIAIDYLALGLDPEKVCIYRQSQVPEHTELQSILNNVVPVSYLLRAHAYKDARQKGEEVNAGVFNYPVLMAADIILYDTDVVPVGRDQKQHVEYARDFAEKFNLRYGTTFKLPEPLIMEDSGEVPGIDGRKMSKSYHNFIRMDADKEEIREAVMSIPTDSQPVHQPKVDYTEDIVYKLHTFFTPPLQLAEITQGYREGGLSYKESKERLMESIENVIRPLREKRREIEEQPELVREVLAKGARSARREAAEKMAEVREKIGLASVNT